METTNSPVNIKMTNKKKKRLTIILSLVLVAVIVIGATLAWLFSSTDSKENVFTFADNIKGYLDEPSWDPDEALQLVPGKKIDKDPQITNNSTNAVTEYAAIRLTFQDGAGNTLSDADTLKLLNLIDIEWSNNWTLYNGTLTTASGVVTAATAEQIYVFNDTLPQNVTSDPVFYSVTIKDSVTPDQLKWLAGNYGHTSDCYEYGIHDNGLCTITYRHHEKCAIFGEAGKKNVAKGGTVNGKTCDCNATAVHESTCPSLIGTLKTGCGHTTLISGIGNFIIKVEGAVVQADSFDGLFGTDTTKSYASDALVTLFN